MQTACPADTTDEHPYKTLRGAHPGGIACTGQADVYTVSQNNTPTLASCSFDKHGLILTSFGRQHRHTFKNDVPIQFTVCLHFYFICF